MTSCNNMLCSLDARRACQPLVWRQQLQQLQVSEKKPGPFMHYVVAVPLSTRWCRDFPFPGRTKWRVKKKGAGFKKKKNLLDPLANDSSALAAAAGSTTHRATLSSLRASCPEQAVSSSLFRGGKKSHTRTQDNIGIPSGVACKDTHRLCVIPLGGIRLFGTRTLE